MRFTQIRDPEQSARQALHRVRDRYMSQRTGLINQMRSFLLEFGLAIRQGAGVFRLDVPRVLGDEENELPPSMRTLLSDLWNDFRLLEIRIEELSKQIQRSVQYSDTARRLMTVPGIGPLAASALEASAGNGHQFVNGRFFAAWLGLTPREYSTGGKTTLLGISKRGNTYLRRILIHGADPACRPATGSVIRWEHGLRSSNNACTATRLSSHSRTRSLGSPGRSSPDPRRFIAGLMPDTSSS